MLQLKIQALVEKVRIYIESHVSLEERPTIRSKQDLMEMYPECFDGTIGCFDDDMYHITLDPEVPPVVHAPRRVPIQLKDKLQAELREMESQDIIARPLPFPVRSSHQRTKKKLEIG